MQLPDYRQIDNFWTQHHCDGKQIAKKRTPTCAKNITSKYQGNARSS